MATKQLVHSICWICNKKQSTVKCTTCFRSYHMNCLDKYETENEQASDMICPVCIWKEKTIDNYADLNMIPLIIQRALDDKSFAPLKKSLKPRSTKKHNDSVIDKPMDLKKIKKKTNDYQSFYELYIDVELIFHNCLSWYGENHEKTQLSRLLVEHVYEQIESVEVCSSCHRNADKYPDTWFTMVCNSKPPHLLIWAKMEGYDFWPAKFLSVDEDSPDKIKVRFFGDQKLGSVPVKNCLTYTSKSPHKGRNTDLFKTAIEEAKTYGDSLRKKYGSFQFASTAAAINPELIDKYIAKMIPTYADYTEDPEDSTDEEYVFEEEAEESDEEEIESEASECDDSFVEVLDQVMEDRSTEINIQIESPVALSDDSDSNDQEQNIAKTLSNLMKMTNGLSTRKRKFEDDYANTKTAYADSKKKCERLSAALNEMKSERDAQAKTIDDLRKLSDQKNEELKKVENKYKDSSKQLAEMKDKIRSFQIEKERSVKELEQKCSAIVAKIKQDLADERKNQTKCVECGARFEKKRFCSTFCERIRNSLAN